MLPQTAGGLTHRGALAGGCARAHKAHAPDGHSIRQLLLDDLRSGVEAVARC